MVNNETAMTNCMLLTMNGLNSNVPMQIVHASSKLCSANAKESHFMNLSNVKEFFILFLFSNNTIRHFSLNFDNPNNFQSALFCHFHNLFYRIF